MIILKKKKNKERKDNVYRILSLIIGYESGELSENEIIRMFQELVNSGLAWKLQGHYGRMAKAMLDSGTIHYPNHQAISSILDSEMKIK